MDNFLIIIGGLISGIVLIICLSPEWVGSTVAKVKRGYQREMAGLNDKKDPLRTTGSINPSNVGVITNPAPCPESDPPNPTDGYQPIKTEKEPEAPGDE